MTGLATVGGVNFAHSIYFNSINGFQPVSVSYNLDKHYRLFQTSFGLQNDPRETVVFEVFVNGRRVLNQEVGPGKAWPFSVDVSGAGTLKLQGTSTSNVLNGFSNRDLVTWGDAQLLGQ
jgi:NPCBM/NEW2 domain.